MTRKSGDEFRRLASQASTVADEWAAKWADGPLPVPLEELATDVHVRRLAFEPLLSSAGLEREETGFVVCVNPQADGVDHRSGETVGVTAVEWAKLKPPLRFTLAHELAHLIFLRLAKNRPESFQGHEGELETACNQMAGSLLLPKLRLAREAGGAKLFDADHIAGLLGHFRVSPDAFILRLSTPDLTGSMEEADGVLALVRAYDERLSIDAIHVSGTRATVRWGPLRKNRSGGQIDDLMIDRQLVERAAANDRVQEPTQVVWHPGAKQVLPCHFTARRLRTNPLAVLIAIRVDGDPNVEGIR